MYKKPWPYWAKGALIVTIIALPSALVLKGASPSIFLMPFYIFWWVMGIPQLQLIAHIITGDPCLDGLHYEFTTGPQCVDPTPHPILVFIIALILEACIGAILGWLYGKSKARQGRIIR